VPVLERSGGLGRAVENGAADASDVVGEEGRGGKRERELGGGGTPWTRSAGVAVVEHECVKQSEWGAAASAGAGGPAKAKGGGAGMMATLAILFHNYFIKNPNLYGGSTMRIGNVGVVDRERWTARSETPSRPSTNFRMIETQEFLTANTPKPRFDPASRPSPPLFGPLARFLFLSFSVSLDPRTR
jgi:hypothetical protein